jgi:urease accessory protein
LSVPAPYPGPLPASGAREKKPPLPPFGGRGQGEGGVHGTAQICFTQSDSRTRLSQLYQRHPLRVLFPAPESGDLPTAVLVTTSGGLVGGDRLDIHVRLGETAQARVTAAAAEKAYRSLGPKAKVAQHLEVGNGAWLEFLPPETILFDGARLDRTTIVDLAAGAGFLGGGITVFGRRARGERFTYGRLRERWVFHRDGRLIWGDALLLDGDIAATIADPACFDGAAAFATLVLALPGQQAQRFLAPARGVLAGAAPDVRAGATMVGGLLVARWLAYDAAALRRAYADLACYLREAAMGLPARLPRLWHV